MKSSVVAAKKKLSSLSDTERSVGSLLSWSSDVFPKFSPLGEIHHSSSIEAATFCVVVQYISSSQNIIHLGKY